MNVGEVLYYYSGLCGNQDNTKFFELFYHLKDSTFMNSRWDGDYYVRTFSFEHGVYEIWENTEYGILHSIKRIA